MIRLPVLRPRLPSAEQLLPYLRTLDICRIYTNHGPLLEKFQARVAAQLELHDGGVVCTSSGTSAIIGSILASAGRATQQRPLAIVPAFTFVATAAAVMQCGYEPYLADVDADSWMLDPSSFIHHPVLHKAGVVVPVAPFGRPVPQEPWFEFRSRTGIPVVIDGAASFDTILQAPAKYLGDIPLALSFHATKSFGIGEGGAIATQDTDLAARAAAALNFGFQGTRNSHSAGTNGKMSEYAAAVGLAELDGWKSKYTALSNVMALYRQSMETAQLSKLLLASPDISTSYALLACRSSDEAKSVERSFHQHNIDYRRWYGAGVQDHKYFSNFPRAHLASTSDVLSRVIGLPVAPDLSETEVERVVTAIREAISG